jgi:hypothetical protein
MVSSAITPTRTIAVLIGVAVIAVAGFAVVRSGVFEPETVQGAIPGPGSSSPSVSPSASESPTALPSPTPTASPEPTTPAQIKAKNIADAKARLVEYYETTAKVGNNGYEGWRRQLVPFWGSFALRDAMSDVYTLRADSGNYTTGAASVESTRVESYTPAEEGFEEVKLEACVDFAGIHTYTSDGDVVERQAGAPTRYYLSYVIRHHGQDGAWAINAEEQHVERAC